MSENKTCRCTNDGVRCEATNCAHHTPDGCCTAPLINVSNQRATEPKDTCCSTFRKK